MENCTVHSILDDFTDELLRVALECRSHALSADRFRVEYVYETGEYQLTVPFGGGGLMERNVTLTSEPGDGLPSRSPGPRAEEAMPSCS